jgi:putative SOS response-associated peptidase YedK
MCGRTSLFSDPEALERHFGATLRTDGGYTPRYNIAPGDRLWTVSAASPETIAPMRWGIDGPRDGTHINARAESIDRRRTFAEAWAERPCLVATDGFYEWADRGRGRRQPVRIYDPTGPFALGGIWTTDDAGDPTVAIITCAANDVVAPIHDRMPVVVPDGAYDRWLQGSPTARRGLCDPAGGDGLTAVEIPTAVNDPSNDHPAVIEPLRGAQAGLDQFSSGG